MPSRKVASGRWPKDWNSSHDPRRTLHPGARWGFDWEHGAVVKLLAISGWLTVAILLVSTLDYHTAIELENERLKARVARMVESPNLAHPICPTGVMVAQRFDKRNRRGEIVKSRWKTVCVNSKEM